MLAIARIAGETAPLLFTALGSRLLTLDPSHPFPSLTVQIFNYATGPYKEEQDLAWAGMLILIAPGVRAEPDRPSRRPECSRASAKQGLTRCWT